MKKLFKSYLFWGIILILISVLIETSIIPIIPSIPILNIIVTIISKGSCSIGISLTIGYFIGYAKQSDEYRSIIMKITKDEIFNNDLKNSFGETIYNCFQQNLIPEIKRELALDMVTKPEIINNINDVYKYDILNSIIQGDKNSYNNFLKEKMFAIYRNRNGDMRSNVDIHVKVFQKDDIIYAESIMKYKSYKNNGVFPDIITCFDDSRSYITDIKIINPNNVNDFEKIEDLNNSQTETIPAFGKSLEYVSSYVVPQRFYTNDTVNIEKKFVFIGHDHWISYGWISICPCQIVEFKLECQDDLTIKDTIVVDSTNVYNVSQTDDKKFVSISTTSWIDTNSGFSIIISNTP